MNPDPERNLENNMTPDPESCKDDACKDNVYKLMETISDLINSRIIVQVSDEMIDRLHYMHLRTYNDPSCPEAIQTLWHVLYGIAYGITKKKYTHLKLASDVLNSIVENMDKEEEEKEEKNIKEKLSKSEPEVEEKS